MTTVTEPITTAGNPAEAGSTPDTDATFGSGGGEPYARALRQADTGSLFLHETNSGELGDSATMDFAKWNADADDTDLTLLRAVTGPVLDIGCGPGRMVRAAMDLGLSVLGIDVSPTAIELATKLGLPVLEGSVFDALPGEGAWQTALLVDGNIGIGGDVPAMLARCRDLLSPTGEIVVELHSDPTRHHTFTGTLVDTHGAQSASFPWAEVGLDRLVEMATPLALELTQAWEMGGRNFCRLARAAK
jgi:SAM-dependent methyltransferase